MSAHSSASSSSQVPMNRHPSGAEPYDRIALNEQQQRKLNEKKVQLRIEDEKYLQSHPEIHLLIQDFFRECFLKKPQNVREFAADYFTNPQLRDRVDELLKTRETDYEVNSIVQQLKVHNI